MIALRHDFSSMLTISDAHRRAKKILKLVILFVSIQHFYFLPIFFLLSRNLVYDSRWILQYFVVLGSPFRSREFFKCVQNMSVLFLTLRCKYGSYHHFLLFCCSDHEIGKFRTRAKISLETQETPNKSKFDCLLVASHAYHQLFTFEV